MDTGCYLGLSHAGRLTAALCKGPLKKVRIIGLNVKAENRAAVGCCRRLGSERIASHEEFMVEVM